MYAQVAPTSVRFWLLDKGIIIVKPRYNVQLGGRGFERYIIEKRYIASSLINRYKGLK